MTGPNEKPDPASRNDADKPALTGQDFGDAFAAYQKIEGLFDLLRRPADAGEAHTDDVLVPGKVLGEFAILRPLAAGGMGQVYLARQESLGRLVALKVCKPEIARDARMKNRFTAEALSLAQLAHPNVVPVLSTGEDQEYLYLAMEYVAGPTLAQVIQAIQIAPADSLASTVVARVLASPDGNDQGQAWGNGHARLDRAYQTWAVQTLQQVAQGLAAAHAAGILHRDIKPANIVFAANGVPKIVDFGLARTARTPSTTVAGEFYGTPAYTSPEQARGDVEAVSPASDVFSFGVLLFECLSLNRPFRGRTSADVLSAVLNSDAPLLRRAEKRIPWELEAITDKCLRKNPSHRYPSAQALADDLRNYLELRPVLARRPSKIGRVGRMIRRRPWAAAFLLTLVIAAVLSVFVAKSAWAEFKADKIRTFAKCVDEGDVALFRCLTGRRPTWLPDLIEQYRRTGIDAYSAAIELEPNAVRPLVQRARLHAAKKETLELALTDFDKAQQFAPGFGSIAKFRGYVLEDLGRNDEGRAVREEAKNLYPTSADDLYWLGVLAHSREHDREVSFDFLSRALLLAPSDYWSRIERAYFARKPAEGAGAADERMMTELEFAKHIRPDLPFAWEYLANAKRATDPIGCKADLREQIERFGLDIMRAHEMSALLQNEKKHEEARALLLSVLADDHGGGTADRLGELEYKLGHFEQARDWCRRAVNEGMRHPMVYIRLASALTALSDWSGAEKAYLDGIAVNQEAFLYQSLAHWYDARGRFADAENIFRKACDLPLELDHSSGSLNDASSVVQNISSGQRTITVPRARAVEAVVKNFGSGHRLFALFLGGRHGRLAESAEVLERGIARLEEALRLIKQPQPSTARLVAEEIAALRVTLGLVYMHAGRRNDAISIVDGELKRMPFRAVNAPMMIDLLRNLGMEESALEVARLAEYTIWRSAASDDQTSRKTANSIVDGQLNRMGLVNELRHRLETRRALRDEISELEYRRLATICRGQDAEDILAEGTVRNPRSVGLQSEYMQVFARAGRKVEAWKAYEKAKELYFAQLGGNEAPALPGEPQPTPIAPAHVAGPWYVFLLQEGKEDEFRRLDERLRAACPTAKTDAEGLLVPRGMAEFRTGRYAAAVESLNVCLEKHLWKGVVNESIIVEALAKSHRALGRRQAAISSYRRVLQISGVEPKLLSEFLCLVVEENGVSGLLRELPAFDQSPKPDMRVSATLTCFAAWATLAKGDKDAAFENLVQAETYVRMASQQPKFGEDEGVVWGVILQIVAEELANKARAIRATEFLKKYPAERVGAMRQIFAIKAKPKPLPPIKSFQGP